MKRIFLILTLLAVSSFAIAGDLNPPAAPGSTMKTLGEVEPRIPLGQADFPVTINQSGSYYLTENVTISTASNAFNITADNVSIDLMGFTITGNSGGGSGVYLVDKKNISISNGAFDGFGYDGIYCSSSVSQNINIKNVIIKNCGNSGIQSASSKSTVENCKVLNCGNDKASIICISVGSQSRVANCLVEGCGANSSGTIVYGIACGNSSQIIGNIVNNNFESSNATYIYTIKSYSGSIVRNNTVSQNGANMEAGSQRFYGIYVNGGTTCIGNSVNDNASELSGSYSYGYGIRASYGCLVKDNAVFNNFTDSSGSYTYGMSVTGGCLVDSNTIYLNTGTNLSVTSNCVLGTNLAP